MFYNFFKWETGILISSSTVFRNMCQDPCRVGYNTKGDDQAQGSFLLQ